MPRGDYLGEFEQMVLLAVARLGATAYGMAILDEIERHTGNESAVASVYAALDRLERRGLVSSRIGEPTRERGGRAKRYFVLERAGAEELHRVRTALESFWDGLELDVDGWT